MKLFTILTLFTIASADHIPPGYYAFKTASKLDGVPPPVRKPPYLSSNTPCPGTIPMAQRFSQKYTLCGDLNRGYVPANPLNEAIQGQPYPFDLVKKKTLKYLSKTLPFLKQDIHNIPKVTKFQEGHLIAKRSVNESEVTTLTPDLANSTASNSSEPQKSFKFGDYALYRQRNCQNGEGLICQLMQMVSNGQSEMSTSSSDGSQNGGFLNSVSQALSVLSAAHSAANTAQSIGTIAQLITNKQPASGGDGHGKTKFFSGLLDSFVGASSGSSPVSSFMDYLGVGGNSMARRKKPVDVDDFVVDASGTVQRIPPTPCPSVQEYVAPVYARNYQGVWKYVVQIPDEGYFTQTVERTTCIKGKCDFTDGVCHESPRWVSLLVAEAFYPKMNHKQPPASPQPTYKDPYLHNNEDPMVHEAANQYHNIFGVNHLPSFKEESSSLPEAKAESGRSIGPRKVSKRSTDSSEEDEKCDGYDAMGCYVLRVYYDWFLVPGSCKCWKSPSRGGSIQTIKKIFTG